MRSALQKRCVRASRRASLNRDTGLSYAIFPILLLGSGQCQRWVQWHAHLPCAAKPDVCYWHLADMETALKNVRFRPQSRHR